MAIHKLKIATEYFYHCLAGTKNFEVRLNDRDFNEGDIVYLQEYYAEQGIYTGMGLKCEILYVLRNFHALQLDYVVFSFKILEFIDNKTTHK